MYFNTNINYTDISIKVPGSNIVLYKLDSNGKYINQNAPTDGPATLAMHSFYEGATYNKTKDSYTLNINFNGKRTVGKVNKGIKVEKM